MTSAAATIDEAEWDALEALHREKQRVSGVETAPQEPWKPRDPLALAVWITLPVDGWGVEYTGFVRRLVAAGWPEADVRSTLVGLCMMGRCYCSPSANATSSVGRGTDPRLGTNAFRTGGLMGDL